MLSEVVCLLHDYFLVRVSVFNPCAGFYFYLYGPNIWVDAGGSSFGTTFLLNRLGIGALGCFTLNF